MNPNTVCIDGIGFWSPQWPSWAHAAPALRGVDPGARPPLTAKPSPAGMGANERRRAPDAVLLALEVAAAACADSGHAPAELASVFASAHGDLPTTDAMCRTLAVDPLLLSPTRFHHSVHNAASGYWAIQSGSRAASTALSAHEHSFAAGWLEAATQCVLEQVPVLLVAYDTAAVGALASVNSSRGLLALAMVLSPRASERSRFVVRWALGSSLGPARGPRSEAARAMSENAMAPGLPLFEALAEDAASTSLHWPLGPDSCALCVELTRVP